MATAGPTILETISRFDRQAKGAFLQKFGAKTQQIEKKFAGAIEKVPSDGPQERYPFLAATPMLKEYDEGEVPMGDLGNYEVTINNKRFGMAVAVGRDYLSDIERMPGAKKALLDRVGSGLAIRAANFWNKLIADLVLGEGIFASITSWDGYSLFNTSHTGGSNQHSGTAADYTEAVLRAEHEAALDLFCGMTDPESNDNIREEAPNKLICLVDPQHLGSYATLFRSMFVPSNDMGTNAHTMMANVFMGTGSNPYVNLTNVDGLGNQVLPIGWSRLRNKSTTIYIDVTDDVPGPKAIIHQEREEPTLEYLGPTESNPVWTLGERVVWKTRMRGNLGIGDHQKLVEVTKS